MSFVVATASGNQYVVLMTEHLPVWVEAAAVPNQRTTTITGVVVHHIVIKQGLLFDYQYYDNENTQFSSPKLFKCQLFSTFCALRTRSSLCLDNLIEALVGKANEKVVGRNSCRVSRRGVGGRSFALVKNRLIRFALQLSKQTDGPWFVVTLPIVSDTWPVWFAYSWMDAA
ncbi:hypothetical protein CSKR_106195 [Clonorchis sinensis]|uniref:Uncharacterized protein n=2 Tax=Clonorchis sinensis TaxID=79923 RepID=A0A8T1M4X1_CLOSI|nr:hypothetical protein CSKR_106195 [Clonorchis sinensis]GAA52647.1 gap-Pol polyprotein [Clonorchis sinensis]